jgi:hypothetical protein
VIEFKDVRVVLAATGAPAPIARKHLETECRLAGPGAGAARGAGGSIGGRGLGAATRTDALRQSRPPLPGRPQTAFLALPASGHERTAAPAQAGCPAFGPFRILRSVPLCEVTHGRSPVNECVEYPLDMPASLAGVGVFRRRVRGFNTARRRHFTGTSAPVQCPRGAR